MAKKSQFIEGFGPTTAIRGLKLPYQLLSHKLKLSFHRHDPLIAHIRHTPYPYQGNTMFLSHPKFRVVLD
jgi:hypothetical protein